MAKKSMAVAADVSESATIALPVPAIQSNPDIQKICDYLSEKSFRPKIDPDGAIGFKCESWKIYLDAYADNHGFRMYICVFG